MSAATMVIYTGLLMAVTVGMTAWRLATVRGTIRTQVDGHARRVPGHLGSALRRCGPPWRPAPLTPPAQMWPAS
jgi:hypothetical protein